MLLEKYMNCFPYVLSCDVLCCYACDFYTHQVDRELQDHRVRRENWVQAALLVQLDQPEQPVTLVQLELLVNEVK